MEHNQVAQKDEAFDPFGVRFFSAQAQMAYTYYSADLLEKFGFAHSRGVNGENLLTAGGMRHDTHFAHVRTHHSAQYYLDPLNIAELNRWTK